MSPRVARKLELSREAIATAALRLIDRHGLDEFSTRKLGAALGCEAMAIYYYYPSKDDLLDAVVDRLIAPVHEVARTGGDDWIGVLRAVATAYRAIALEHPHAFALLATRRFATEASYELLDTLFARSREAGVSDRDAARFYRAVSSYVNGFALNQLAAPRPRRGTLDRKFARVAAVHAHLEPEHLDELFASGLELFLAGLHAQSADGQVRKS
jgi:AcrR family transcriptional regulator